MRQSRDKTLVGTLLSLLLAALLLSAPAFSQNSDLAPLDLSLFAAVKTGNLTEVQSLIQRGADVNATESDGASPVLWAAYYHDEAAVSALLEAGAEANVANRYGITPLLLSARVGDGDVVTALLEYGADPLFSSDGLETPLMAAAGSGLTDIVVRFIAAGIDVDAIEPVQNQTALMWAAEQGHGDVVRVLVDAGADLNAVSEIASMDHGHVPQGRAWVGWASGGMTAPMFAARQGQIEAVRILAEAGADLDFANPDGITALMLAVINDHLDLAALLLDFGANPDDGSMYELVQLHNLDRNATADDVTRLRPDHENTLTPVALLGLMLEAGADPAYIAGHTFNMDGNPGPGATRPAIIDSAYKSALGNKDVLMLDAMLDAGADPDFVTVNDDPPLHILFNELGGRGFGGRGGPAIKRFEAPRTLEESVVTLLEHGADPNLASSNGTTPLHLAAQQNQAGLIRALVAAGARLDTEDEAGLTPLDHALGQRPPAPPTLDFSGRPARPPAAQADAVAVLQELMDSTN